MREHPDKVAQRPPATLAHGRATAETMRLAERIEWIEADLGSWTPPTAASMP